MFHTLRPTAAAAHGPEEETGAVLAVADEPTTVVIDLFLGLFNITRNGVLRN